MVPFFIQIKCKLGQSYAVANALAEAEIASAMRTVAQTDRWMIEGAAGVAVAGLMKSAADYPGRKVAAIVCGRNIALDKFLHAVTGASAKLT